jgi:short-subunit dehydrogenase
MPLTPGLPPENTPEPVADGVWIVDAQIDLLGGAPMPIRMTIVRLANGDLLLHSPCRHDPALAAEIERLGRIRHLVAPSFGHWMFLQEWLRAYPDVTTWGAPGLRDRGPVRTSGLRLDQDLSDQAPVDWAAEMDQVVVRGGPFAEVAFFHKPSRTLILTDLVQNLPPENLPPGWRGAARLLGVTAPGGRAPAYLRAVLHVDRAEASDAAIRLIAFEPARVIFSHGLWFRHEATRRLKTALSWLLPTATREFAGRTVVITGASSGIGRAAALAFARRGARLVLAARRAELLEEVARACNILGGQAIAAPTDVTDSEAVERLAQAAETAFGPINIWINNAGVGVFGSYQDTDLALHRRTIEVNLMGAMHGAAAVVPRFLRQGSGTLINNISISAWAPTPFAAAYTASKFGLRGFTASLRQEMAPHRHIHVCGVFPAVIDTPGFAHGANTTGLDLDPGPLLHRPEQVAETFVSLARRPRAEVAVGWPSHVAKAAYAASPRLMEHVIERVIRISLTRAKPAQRTEGALLRPSRQGVSASGGWLRRKRLPSASVLGVAAAIGGLGLVVGLIAAQANRRGLVQRV